MSVSYSYTPKGEAEAESLNSVDVACCAYFDIEVDEKEFSGPYLDLRAFATSANYNATNNTGNLSDIDIDTAIESNNGEWSEMMLNFFRVFLSEKYTFRSWR